MRIALFTPFSPELGGGSGQFRSLLPDLRDRDIEWFYLADHVAPGSDRHQLGSPFTTSQFLRELTCQIGPLHRFTNRVPELTDRMSADLYWVVAHNEGILVADELCARGKRVHLSVHDDPISMFKRSRKYRLFAPLISRKFSKLLKSVESVDVISPFMREAYEREYKRESIAVYRFVPELCPFEFKPGVGTLTVGHIGSVYEHEPFRHFVNACLEYAMENRRNLKIVRIGSSPEVDVEAAKHPEVFENHGEMDERDALPILANCDFLYAMYPASVRFKVFRRLSLPMKLSTYVQAQRPIFAQTPEDSSLAKIVNQYRIGIVCNSDDHTHLRETIGAVLNSQVKREQFELVRSELMGEGQIKKLRIALTRMEEKRRG